MASVQVSGRLVSQIVPGPPPTTPTSLRIRKQHNGFESGPEAKRSLVALTDFDGLRTSNIMAEYSELFLHGNRQFLHKNQQFLHRNRCFYQKNGSFYVETGHFSIFGFFTDD